MKKFVIVKHKIRASPTGKALLQDDMLVQSTFRVVVRYAVPVYVLPVSRPAARDTVSLLNA